MHFADRFKSWRQEFRTSGPQLISVFTVESVSDVSVIILGSNLSQFIRFLFAPRSNAKHNVELFKDARNSSKHEQLE